MISQSGSQEIALLQHNLTRIRREHKRIRAHVRTLVAASVASPPATRWSRGWRRQRHQQRSLPLEAAHGARSLQTARRGVSFLPAAILASIWNGRCRRILLGGFRRGRRCLLSDGVDGTDERDHADYRSPHCKSRHKSNLPFLIFPIEWSKRECFQAAPSEKAEDLEGGSAFGLARRSIPRSVLRWPISRPHRDSRFHG